MAGAVSAGALVAIVAGSAAARSGLYDSTLAARMGSEALKFPIQLAFVATFSALLASLGFIVGRRIIEVQVLVCAALAVLSSLLFYAWDVVECASGPSGEGLFDFTVLGLAGALSLPLGWACARQGCSWGRLTAATLPLLATLVLVAHVQIWHWSPSSQQIGREVVAPLTSILIFGPVVVLLATLAWILWRRLSPRPLPNRE